MDQPFSAYQGNEPYFFVSYAHSDAQTVYPELVRLKQLGLNIWYDEGIAPGAEWRDELASAIRGASGFLYLVTKNSVNSENCRKEINFALQSNCAFVAVHLERVDMPDGLVFSLSNRQAILKYELPEQQYISKLRRIDISERGQTEAPDYSFESSTSRQQHRSVSNYAMIGIAGLAIVLAIVMLVIVFKPAETTVQDLKVSRVDEGELPSVAVLPFTNMSNDEANIPFTAGIHDDLLTHISHIKALRTLSRTSVMQYKDTIKTIPQIGQELGVDSILEGSIQRSGNLVRINMQLIDASTDEHLWAEIFDRELTTTNLFAVQGEIAASVAEALRATLSPAQKQLIQQAPTQSMAAYDLYLLGRYEWNQRTAQSIEKSRTYFEQALEADPNYVKAMSGLADSYIQLVKYGNMRGEVAYPIAEQLIDKALTLDPSASEAWASLGSLKSATGNIDEAEDAFQQATLLDPNNFSAWMWYGDFLNQHIVRRYKEGMAAYLRAEALEPMSKPLNLKLIAAYHRRGDFLTNKIHQQRLARIDPDNAIRYQLYIAGNKKNYGKQAEAIYEMREINVKDPTYYTAYVWLRDTYISLGDFDEARTWANRGDKLVPRGNLVNSVLIGEQRFTEVIRQLEKLPTNPEVDRALFQLYFGKGDINAARTHLNAYTGSLNKQLIVRPGNYENIWNLTIADFWIHHGSEEEQLRGLELATEMKNNLTYMISQDFKQSITYFLLAYASGLTGDEKGMYKNLDNAIDAHWMSLTRTAYLKSLTASPQDLDLRLNRIQAAIEVQKSSLARMDLPDYVPPVIRTQVAVSPERLSQYTGFYTDGNLLYEVYLNNNAELSYRFGGVVDKTLRAISRSEFYPSNETSIQLEFFQDDNGVVTHLTRKSTGKDDAYLKVVTGPPVVIKVEPAILKRYTGQYQFNPLSGNENTVKSDLTILEVELAADNTLWIKIKQRYVFRSQILPFADNEFFMPGLIGSLRFDTDTQTGQVNHAVRIRDGTETRFERVTD